MPARTLLSQRLWRGVGLAMALLPYGLVAADDHLLSFGDLDEFVATELAGWLPAVPQFEFVTPEWTVGVTQLGSAKLYSSQVTANRSDAPWIVFP